MNRITYISNADLSANHGQFTETVLLTDDAKDRILKGSVLLRKGQWIIDGRTGQRGQFVGVKRKLTGKQIAVREARTGMTFADYQTKLAA